MKNVEWDMFQIVSNFCDNYDCIRQAYQGALEEIPFDVKRVHDIMPDNSNEMNEFMQSFEKIIYSVDEFNVDEKLKEMEAIQAKLREDEILSPKEKYVGLAAGSVAMESTKLWTSVYRNPSHPLTNIRTVSKSKRLFQHRSLQGVSVEFVGLDFDLNFTIFADFASLIAFLGIPFPAIFASLWAYSISNNKQDNSPSTQPSISQMPSTKPSLKPSLQPSISNMPTGKPSAIPSRLPSLSPSLGPSSAPSISHAPTLFSSRNPSTIPSLNPSLGPTR